jgi:1-acyl-sn-glycerol-3-phosphate acyltransferase
MNATDAVWAVGRLIIGTWVRVVARLRVYGAERVPLDGGVVLAFNHFHWVDPPAFGAASPRTVYFMAKIEAHRMPGLGQLIRAFGTFSVRRGESDREAVRLMRQIVRDGHALGLFVEGTRQREGVPGKAQPGAAMVAIQEGVPVVCAAVHGTETWKLGNFRSCSIAWGEPMTFENLPRNGKGYRAASEEIEQELHRLWAWLVDLHKAGRPRVATPPGR